MKLRIFWKSFKLAIRTGKRFIIFVLVYMFLIIFTSYMLTNLFGARLMIVQNLLDYFEKSAYIFTADMGFQNVSFFIWGFILVITGTVLVSTFYGFIVSGYRKREVATLRTIGWDAGSIRTLFLGELILVFLVAFLLVIEIIFHVIGITHYLFASTNISGLEGLIIPGLVLLITFSIILGCQVLGTFVGYRRMLRISPMDAMRKAV
ncbi:MAG: hypothetical protein ACTSRG_16280 [Candidatus Helarchaeota archaeon]